MNVPTYSYPPGVFAVFVRDLLLLRKRDFRHDAQACIVRIRPTLKVIGQENIPQSGPCVITVNHYHRAGFGAQWLLDRAVWPKECAHGRNESERSIELNGKQSWMALTFEAMLPCERMTPCGLPALCCR